MSYTLSRSCEKHQLCFRCYTFYTEFHNDSNHIKGLLKLFKYCLWYSRRCKAETSSALVKVIMDDAVAFYERKLADHINGRVPKSMVSEQSVFWKVRCAMIIIELVLAELLSNNGQPL